MMEDVYISFEGTPVNKNGILHFGDDVVISIGDFTRNLSEINNNRGINLDMRMFYQLGASDIVIKDDFVELKK